MDKVNKIYYTKFIKVIPAITARIIFIFFQNRTSRSSLFYNVLQIPIILIFHIYMINIGEIKMSETTKKTRSAL